MPMSYIPRSGVPRIAVDFDGVLYPGGAFEGPHIVNQPPVPGAIFFLEEVTQHYEVLIFTARLVRELHPDFVEIDDNGGVLLEYSVIANAIHGWLRDYGLSERAHKEVHIYPPTLGKPGVHLYLDDRAWKFDGVFPSLTVIQGFRPWWKVEE